MSSTRADRGQMRMLVGPFCVVSQAAVGGLRRTWLSLRKPDGSVDSLFAPLTPGQPDDECVEDSQGAVLECRQQDDAVQLGRR